MKNVLLILLITLTNLCHAQDKDTRAQAYYIAAEGFYNNSEFEKALGKLTETEKVLGTSNAKIEYLKVKCLVAMKKFAEAKQELTGYFDLAANNKGTEKYNEMTVLLGTLDELESEERNSTINAAQISNAVLTMDKIYKQCFYYMLAGKEKKAKVESIVYRDLILTISYSGNIFTPSHSISIKNIESVQVHEDKVYPKNGPYDVLVFFKDGTQFTAFFTSLADEHCAANLANALNQLIEAVDKK